MEILSKHVIDNNILDMQNKDIMDITKAVSVLMTRFMQSMQNDFPEIHVDHVRLCGSMAEKTRIWNGESQQDELEFDYLAVLNGWPHCDELQFQHLDTCTGSMKILYSIMDTHSANGKTEFLSNQVGQTFIYNYLSSVEQRCRSNFCPQYASIASGHARVHLENGCSFCTVYTDSGKLGLVSTAMDCSGGGKIRFEWISSHSDEYSRKSKYLPARILLDFHPVIAMESNQIVSTESGPSYHSLVSTQTPLFLFPKRCFQHNCEYMSWRISTHDVEVNLIKETSLEHRYAYMVLKYLILLLKTVQTCIRSNFAIHSGSSRYFANVSSYHLKSILLQHINTCDNPYKGRNSCITEMLEMLASCYKREYLPHFLLRYNLFKITSRYNTIPEYFDLQVIGHVTSTISEILNLQNAHCDFQDIKRDMIALYIIIFESERVLNLKLLSDNFGDTYRDKIEEETVRVLAHTLAEFISARCKISAEEMLKDITVKYFGSGYCYFGFQEYPFHLEYIKSRKDEIDKRFRKIKIKDIRSSSNCNYFMDTMNKSWLLEGQFHLHIIKMCQKTRKKMQFVACKYYY